MYDGGFVIVKSRRKKSAKSSFNTKHTKGFVKQGQTEVDINEDVAIKKVLSAKEAFIGTQFLKDSEAAIDKALRCLPGHTIKEIVCYGLGHFTECHIAQHQLAFLLLIKQLFNASVFIHDPIFYKVEVRLLQRDFGLNIISENEEGKRKLKLGVNTLLYLPHCSKQLTNNFLWCNWGSQLENCVLFGNSFTSILNSELNTNAKLNTHFIQRIQPFCNELSLENNFKYQDIFNNTSIHSFPQDKLSTLDQGFWEDCDEPSYRASDTEFITNQ